MHLLHSKDSPSVFCTGVRIISVKGSHTVLMRSVMSHVCFSLTFALYNCTSFGQLSLCFKVSQLDSVHVASMCAQIVRTAWHRMCILCFKNCFRSRSKVVLQTRSFCVVECCQVLSLSCLELLQLSNVSCLACDMRPALKAVMRRKRKNMWYLPLVLV